MVHTLFTVQWTQNISRYGRVCHCCFVHSNWNLGEKSITLFFNVKIERSVTAMNFKLYLSQHENLCHISFIYQIIKMVRMVDPNFLSFMYLVIRVLTCADQRKSSSLFQSSGSQQEPSLCPLKGPRGPFPQSHHSTHTNISNMLLYDYYYCYCSFFLSFLCSVFKAIPVFNPGLMCEEDAM